MKRGNLNDLSCFFYMFLSLDLCSDQKVIEMGKAMGVALVVSLNRTVSVGEPGQCLIDLRPMPPGNRDLCR